MRIPLHSGPYAGKWFDTDSEPPTHIKYLFAPEPILPFHDVAYLDAHVYSLQWFRGSQTSYGYVYSGIEQYVWRAIPVALLDTSTDTSDIVSPTEAETEPPKRPRGRPRKVTA